MNIYRVGGSVRDELLGLPVTDRDYVVVGATPEVLVQWGIDQGLGVFRPVGKDFPVFLHPLTHEEYALARTERSTAPGYRGFAFHAAPDVTLAQDLARRDFTINAMALDAAGTLIDPFGGAADLKARVLRHVGPSFVEDPVRVLRGARFAARFGFAIAPDTLELMREMARNGEVDALVPERVWQELARGLMEPHPVEMFRVLEACGALDKALPELAPFHVDAPNMAALRKAASVGLALPVRFAALAGCVDAARLAQLVERVRVPNDCRDLARLYLRHARELAAAATLDAAALAQLILGADGLRQEARFEALIAVAHLYCTEADAGMKQGTSRLHAAHAAARAVDAGAIARQHADAQAIAAAVRAARVAAIARAIGMPAA